VELLATATKKELEALQGFGPKTVEKVWQAAMKAMYPKLFLTAREAYKQRSKNVRLLTTGSKALDTLIGGGIETGSITEIVGEYGSGKTELCFQLSVNVQLPEDKGGLDGKALFFDTENTFRADRIVQMAKSVGLGEEVLDGIIYAPCYTTDHQIFLLEHSDKIIKENNVRLLIVDSLMAHFRSEYIGRESLAERQQLLNKYLRKLIRIAVAFNLAIVVTNQVVADPSFFGASKPTGGNILGHASTTRLWIRRPDPMGYVRIARLFESPWLPSGETVFLITEEGVKDKDEEET